MKIYFAGSIRGGRDDVNTYTQIINHLKNYGEVLTEHVGDKTLEVIGEDKLTDKQIHDRDINWVLQSDVLIAEVSTSSLGVGYEVGRAIENGKKVLCLYKLKEGKKLSAMISGSPNIVVAKYDDIEDAKGLIDEFLNKHSILKE